MRVNSSVDPLSNNWSEKKQDVKNICLTNSIILIQWNIAATFKIQIIAHVTLNIINCKLFET